MTAGRPYSVHLPPELVADVDDQATQHGRSRSWVVREALAAYIDSHRRFDANAAAQIGPDGPPPQVLLARALRAVTALWGADEKPRALAVQAEWPELASRLDTLVKALDDLERAAVQGFIDRLRAATQTNGPLCAHGWSVTDCAICGQETMPFEEDTG